MTSNYGFHNLNVPHTKTQTSSSHSSVQEEVNASWCALCDDVPLEDMIEYLRDNHSFVRFGTVFKAVYNDTLDEYLQCFSISKEESELYERYTI